MADEKKHSWMPQTLLLLVKNCSKFVWVTEQWLQSQWQNAVGTHYYSVQSSLTWSGRQKSHDQATRAKDSKEILSNCGNTPCVLPGWWWWVGGLHTRDSRSRASITQRSSDQVLFQVDLVWRNVCQEFPDDFHEQNDSHRRCMCSMSDVQQFEPMVWWHQIRFDQSGLVDDVASRSGCHWEARVESSIQMDRQHWIITQEMREALAYPCSTIQIGAQRQHWQSSLRK